MTAERFLHVPGLGLGAPAWRPVQDAWGATAETALLPGYGVPGAAADRLDPERLGEVLADRWLRGRAPCVLLGHSASCQVVAHAARSAPEAVEALVLVGPTTDPRATSWPALASRWLRTAVHERPAQVPVLVGSYRRTGLRSMARAMDAARRDDVRTVLADLAGLADRDVPVLVLRGHRDRICPEDWAADLVDRCAPGSRLQTLPVGAHMVPLTHGTAVARAVRAWRPPTG